MNFHDCKTTHPKTIEGESDYVLLYPMYHCLPIVAKYFDEPFVRQVSAKKKIETHWEDTDGQRLFYLTPYMWAEIEYPNEKGGEE